LAQVGSPAAAAQLGPPPVARYGGEADCTEAGVRLGRIVWIDRFGNAVTDLDRVTAPGTELAGGGAVRVAGRRIAGPLHGFADGEPGRPFWYWGSGGTLEIAVRDGSAADALQLERGMAIDRTDHYADGAVPPDRA
jgi:S-adenosylmethionine hydrolase